MSSLRAHGKLPHDRYAASLRSPPELFTIATSSDCYAWEPCRGHGKHQFGTDKPQFQYGPHRLLAGRGQPARPDRGRPVAFFTWNAQTFAERFRRRGLIFLMALLRPFLYSTNRKFATRAVHTVLRGVTRDRLDLLGEEFFQYKLKPRPERARRAKGAGTGAIRGGSRAGQPGVGARDAAAGAASGREADCGQPPGVSRRHGDGQVAGAGDPAARARLQNSAKRIRTAAALRRRWRANWTFLSKSCGPR